MTVHCLDALALCQPKGGAKVRAQNLPMCLDEDTGFASHCSRTRNEKTTEAEAKTLRRERGGWVGYLRMMTKETLAQAAA